MLQERFNDRHGCVNNLYLDSGNERLKCYSWQHKLGLTGYLQIVAAVAVTHTGLFFRDGC